MSDCRVREARYGGCRFSSQRSATFFWGSHSDWEVRKRYAINSADVLLYQAGVKWDSQAPLSDSALYELYRKWRVPAVGKFAPLQESNAGQRLTIEGLAFARLCGNVDSVEQNSCSNDYVRSPRLSAAGVYWMQLLSLKWLLQPSLIEDKQPCSCATSINARWTRCGRLMGKGTFLS